MNRNLDDAFADLKRTMDEGFADLERTMDKGFADIMRTVDEGFAMLEKQQQWHFDELNRLLNVSLIVYIICRFLTWSRPHLP